MLSDPPLQIRMPEAGPLPRLRTGGVQTNPITASREISGNLEIVARSYPGAPNRQRDSLRLPQNAVCPGGGGYRQRQTRGLESVVDVIEDGQRTPVHQDRP